jgi:hypothetical protein
METIRPLSGLVSTKDTKNPKKGEMLSTKGTKTTKKDEKWGK